MGLERFEAGDMDEGRKVLEIENDLISETGFCLEQDRTEGIPCSSLRSQVIFIVDGHRDIKRGSK